MLNYLPVCSVQQKSGRLIQGCFIVRDLAEAVSGIEMSVKEALEEIGERKRRKPLGQDIC